MTRITCICDGCRKEVPLSEAQDQRWLKLEELWSSKMDWEEMTFVYCSLECLVKGKTSGRKMVVMEPQRPA